MFIAVFPIVVFWFPYSIMIEDVIKGIDSSITKDFIPEDISHSLYQLGEISMDDLLENTFSIFCI